MIKIHKHRTERIKIPRPRCNNCLIHSKNGYKYKVMKACYIRLYATKKSYKRIGYICPKHLSFIENNGMNHILEQIRNNSKRNIRKLYIRDNTGVQRELCKINLENLEIIKK